MVAGKSLIRAQLEEIVASIWRKTQTGSGHLGELVKKAANRRTIAGKFAELSDEFEHR